MNILTVLDWPARILIGALVAGAIGGGVFLVVRTSGDEGDPTVQGATTATVQATVATATLAAPTSTQPAPTATSARPTDPPLTVPPVTDKPPPTPDTRIAIRDLPTVDQIQLAKDGTYFIADRGDGCTWVEVFRGTITFQGEGVLHVTLQTDCRTDFNYAFWPDRGEIHIQAE